MTSQRIAVATATAWARLTAVLVSRAYRTMLLTLTAVAVAPMLFGWGSFIIKSGSMEPSISVGDVVIARPFEIGERVAVGRVYVFDDPSASREHLLTHRLVELRDDGSYTSAGDANEATDATPVASGDIRARGVVLAPFVGKPLTWMQDGDWVELGLWLVLTIAAFWAATRDLDHEPPRWTLLRLVRDRLRRRARTETAGAARAVRRSLVPALLGIVLALSTAGLGTANAGFTAQTRNAGWSWTVGTWTQPYVSAVLADTPRSFWMLDETAGATTAQDRSGNRVLGTYRPGATLAQSGALTQRNPGTSMRTSGALAFTSANAVASPASHSVELWFRSTSTTGGYLVGFGSTTGATSATEDRVLRMTPGGQLTYGDWANGPVRTIATPRSYNDGAWHQVVVANTYSNFSETTLYVDGVAVAAGTTSKTTPYAGYWRIGAGTGSPGFVGSVDNVSIYDSVLPASRVAAHYAAR